ncbi:MAG: FAD-binding protein [Anaerolineae bacterium]|nr:FAD-binding protein [Anaerolineae bacterium]
MASDLAAASIPFGGGIALSLTRMNRLLEIDEVNRTAQVEAGIVTADLQAEVENWHAQVALYGADAGVAGRRDTKAHQAGMGPEDYSQSGKDFRVGLVDW